MKRLRIRVIPKKLNDLEKVVEEVNELKGYHISELQRSLETLKVMIEALNTRMSLLESLVYQLEKIVLQKCLPKASKEE